MKKLLLTLICVVGMITIGKTQCTTATNGQYPSTTFDPANSGEWESITTIAWSGEYSVLNVTNGNTYEFQAYRTSNSANRYVTITNSSNTVITFGSTSPTTSVTWVANFTGTIRFYQHNNSSCNSGTALSTRRVKVTTPATNDNSNCSYLTQLSLPTTIGSTTTTGTQSTCGKGNDFPVNSFGSSLYGDGEDAVWEIVVPSGGGNYQFDLGGSGTYKILSLHSACTPSNGNVINYNTTSSSTSTSFSQNLSAGTYYLWTDTWPSPTCGEYSITITKLADPLPPPSNDDPSGAIQLFVNDAGGYGTYSNTSSTNTLTESTPSCASYTGEDVWFYVDVPAGISVLDIDTQTGDITDAGMTIYRGTIGSLTEIECDDDDALDGLMPWIYREDFTPGERIYIRVWEYGGGTTGTFNIWVSTPQALPVELVSFEGNILNDINVLKWSTASENNSDIFEIEWSIDGEYWRPIGDVKAAGNSTELIDYRFTHEDYQKGFNYYRLVQIDYDGKSKIYGPIAIDNTINNKHIIKYVNSMGQEINPSNTIGLVIEVYSDGSTSKVIR